MHFSAVDIALIYSVVIGWWASFALALVNPCLICFSQTSTRSRFTHWVIWAVYVGSGLTVYVPGLGRLQSATWVIPIYGVPILAVSHFVALLWARRQSRLKKLTTNDA